MRDVSAMLLRRNEHLTLERKSKHGTSPASSTRKPAANRGARSKRPSAGVGDGTPHATAVTSGASESTRGVSGVSQAGRRRRRSAASTATRGSAASGHGHGIAVHNRYSHAGEVVLANRPPLRTRTWVSPLQAAHSSATISLKAKQPPTPGPADYASGTNALGTVGSRQISGRFNNAAQPVGVTSTRRQAGLVMAPGQPVHSKYKQDTRIPGPGDYGRETVACTMPGNMSGPLHPAPQSRRQSMRRVATSPAIVHGGTRAARSGAASGGGGGIGAVGMRRVQSEYAAPRGGRPALHEPRLPRGDILDDYGDGGGAERARVYFSKLRARPKSANPKLRRKAAAIAAARKAAAVARLAVTVPSPVLGRTRGESAESAGGSPRTGTNPRRGRARPQSAHPSSRRGGGSGGGAGSPQGDGSGMSASQLRQGLHRAVSRHPKLRNGAAAASGNGGDHDGVATRRSVVAQRSGARGRARARPRSAAPRRARRSDASELPAFLGKSTAHDTPGVGAYHPPPSVRGQVTRSFRDDPSATSLADKRHGFGRAALPRSNSLLGGRHTTHTAHRPSTDTVVGPGAYRTEDARPSSLAGTVAVSMPVSQRPRLSRRGSVTPIAPGPAAYNVSHDTPIAGASQATDSPAFSNVTRQQRMRTYGGSGVPMEPADADQPRPGPGDYDEDVGADLGARPLQSTSHGAPLQLTGRKQSAVSAIANSPSFPFSTTLRTVSSADVLVTGGPP